MSEQWFSTARHPLLVLEFPPHYTFDELDAQMNGMCDALRTHVEKHPRETCGMIVDLSSVEHTEARNRKRILAMIEDLSGLVRKRLVAQAYVIDRPVIRAALTALSWMHRSPWEVQTFGRRGDAETWVLERIRRASTS